MNTPIHIIYASTSGNTEFVMDKVAEKWRSLGAEVFLHRAEVTDISLIKDNKYFLLSTSTWDHGTINPFFNKLLAQIDELKATEGENFAGKKSAFIGLGDMKYTKHHFCAGMKTLKEIWEKNGGESIGLSLPIGREPFDEMIIKMVEDWAVKTLKLYDLKGTSEI